MPITPCGYAVGTGIFTSAEIHQMQRRAAMGANADPTPPAPTTRTLMSRESSRAASVPAERLQSWTSERKDAPWTTSPRERCRTTTSRRSCRSTARRRPTSDTRHDDADGTDGDATDGTDAGRLGRGWHRREGCRRHRRRRHRRHGRRQLRHLVISRHPRARADERGERAMDPLRRCSGDPEAFLAARGGSGRTCTRRRNRTGTRSPDARRRRPHPHHHVAADPVVPAGEGRRTDPGVRVHAIGTDRLQAGTGMADPARITELFDGGATIVLQGLHRNWESVAAFCRALELRLGHPCQVNAYITPPGAQGLPLHADPHDVFVLQTFGRKHWEVHAAPGESEREPIEADVGPGDCIYMPTGTPHAATTGTELSGHLTVGVHVDVVARRPRRGVVVLGEGRRLRRALPVGWTEDPSRFAEILRVATWGPLRDRRSARWTPTR